MPELPHRNLDTGMGLERMAAILQHKSANYDGDLMQGLIALGEKISGKKLRRLTTTPAPDAAALRIIADHARAVDFIDFRRHPAGQRGPRVRAAPPAAPRRLPRPPAGHRGRLPDTPSSTRSTELMGERLPRAPQERRPGRRASSPPRRSASPSTLRQRPRLSRRLPWRAWPRASELPGEVAFKLHDTYGFPIDLTSRDLRRVLRPQGRHGRLRRLHGPSRSERARAAAKRATPGATSTTSGRRSPTSSPLPTSAATTRSPARLRSWPSWLRGLATVASAAEGCRGRGRP